MAAYRVADEVLCRINNGEIVSAKDKYETTDVFEIVCVVDEAEYLIYVPTRHNFKCQLHLDSYNFKKFNIISRFLDSNILLIHEDKVARLYRRADGEACVRCHEFKQMAASNQADGSFLCYACRFNRYR